ncbi:MAG TPA: hypothetical protein PLM53_09940 [Spirochaetota bacterium]|nr:hypothetical protein [Spirochaetota bacterium]HPC41097.1 hypothetical protein [Spirochaetota bacterium]HPL16967.1 hypothetical protein [Spirochaetota bacterium]HQF08790.1 hypothetical protein [Spirochaetota bacterium]HQH97409.1 hypothetical protein [Spirochaetota bacterium]
MNSKKTLFIIAAMVALIVALNLAERALRNKEVSPNPETEDQKDLAALRSLMEQRGTPETGDGSGTAVNTPKEKKFIRDVLYEKDEVCLGDSLEVRLDLQNPDGPVSDLLSRIGGKFGDRVVLNFDEQGEERVNIFVKDPQGNMDTRRIKINVVSCPGRAAVILRASRKRDRIDEGEVTVVKKRGLECPCAYEWDFGDGTTMRTADGKASHNYGKREQDGISSTFIVSVDVTDARNVRARGLTSLTFPNYLWASKQLGFSIVPIVQETAYGMTGNNYEVDVKIKNIYENTIVFDTAAIQAKGCSADDASYDETIKAASIMKRTEIRGGESADDSISIPRSLIPDSACSVSVMLKGSFPDGAPVTGMVFFLKE